ncbi:uncharacterized protein A1O9_00858 [Exophiala aquamarina CBS 119918]|uniref:Uncharacterized protein n=1 Tax=Exophiala aquamarina CBS 119918 TaxID=1182545 RepID=A0A072PS14_9EURO|nr:uncharacterized protein A1O9_00858 [Exophiala aquamarina CBS 119918]KEF62884.1 hypothetical protein A1O9_00858 [Exophiala aquamarina CBS 119918]
MLAARPTPQNPFATSLLPLAVAHDYVMHAVLAISGSHYASSKRDDSTYPLAQEHYAVALRSAKHQITRFSRGMCEDPAALVALLLMLYGNLHGAVLHHLEAAGEILASLPSNLIRCPDSPYRFLIELFIYHNFVSRNMPAGMKMQPPTSALPSLLEIVESSQQHLDGFMFGYAYELYKLIPQIRHLYFARYLDDSPYPAPFDAIRVKLQNWRPAENAGSEWSSTLQVAAHIYQQALFIYLACAEHGPREADLKLLSSVRPHVDQAMALIELLPSTCPEWTTLSWPLLVVGSCLRDRSQQESLIRTGKRLIQGMYCVPKINKVLLWVWADDAAYGPYGLEKVMLERNVKLSIG